MKAFQVLYVLCFTRPRYQVRVYRTTGPLVLSFFSSAEPKAYGELIVYQSSRRLSVCVCLCVSVNIFKLE